MLYEVITHTYYTTNIQHIQHILKKFWQKNKPISRLWWILCRMKCRSPAIWKYDRITSYNVCYTKLLRHNRWSRSLCPGRNQKDERGIPRWQGFIQSDGWFQWKSQAYRCWVFHLHLGKHRVFFPPENHGGSWTKRILPRDCQRPQKQLWLFYDIPFPYVCQNPWSYNFV